MTAQAPSQQQLADFSNILSFIAAVLFASYLIFMALLFDIGVAIFAIDTPPTARTAPADTTTLGLFVTTAIFLYLPMFMTGIAVHLNGVLPLSRIDPRFGALFIMVNRVLTLSLFGFIVFSLYRMAFAETPIDQLRFSRLMVICWQFYFLTYGMGRLGLFLFLVVHRLPNSGTERMVSGLAGSLMILLSLAGMVPAAAPIVRLLPLIALSIMELSVAVGNLLNGAARRQAAQAKAMHTRTTDSATKIAPPDAFATLDDAHETNATLKEEDLATLAKRPEDSTES